jgi:HEAT repeat protein
MNVLKTIGIGVVLLALAPVVAADKKEDVARLMKELKARDIKTRIAAAEELGHIGQIKKSFTEPAVPALIDALHDSDAGVRKAAAEALGKVDPDVKLAVPALQGALKDKTPKEKCPVCHGSGKVGGDSGPASCPTCVGTGVASTPVRIAAAGALGQIGPDAKDAVPALREMQQDSNRAVSRAANMAIQRIMGRGKK